MSKEAWSEVSRADRIVASRHHLEGNAPSQNFNGRSSRATQSLRSLSADDANLVQKLLRIKHVNSLVAEIGLHLLCLAQIRILTHQKLGLPLFRHLDHHNVVGVPAYMDRVLDRNNDGMSPREFL